MVLVLAALSTHGADEGASGSSGVLLSLLLLLLELLLELLLLFGSESYMGGGVWVGNGCSSAAVGWGFEGGCMSEASLDGSGFAGSPGNGNCWDAGGFWSAEGTQGLSVAGLPEAWPGDGHGGGAVGFWAGVVWAVHAAANSATASSGRDTERIVGRNLILN